MGKGKTVLPEASGEMLKPQKRVQHTLSVYSMGDESSDEIKLSPTLPVQTVL